MAMGSPVHVVRVTGRCSRSQHRRLSQVFGMSAELYNACLDTWRGTYKWWREHHPKHPDRDEPFPTELQQSKNNLFVQFTRVREDRPEWAKLDTRVGRGVIRRFDRARTAFYERCENGERPGYPRFKAASRWRSIEVVDAYPAMLVAPGERGNGSAKWWRLQVKGLPRVRFEDKHSRMRTALADGKLVELRVVRTALRVEVHAVFRLPAVTAPTGEATKPVGIDKGLITRLALSDGTLIPAREPDRSVILRRQRALSRAKKGSRTWAKKRTAMAKAWRRETEQARQADFRLAHQLVGSYDGIAVEKLNVAGMLRSKRFSRKMSDQRWAAFDTILEHKAAKAGIRYEKVDPANTSTDCSDCGHRQPMPIKVRVFDCRACELMLDRDLNAAINIRARAGWPRGREGHPPTRCATNFRQKTQPTPRAGSANGHRRTVAKGTDSPAVNPTL